MKKITHKMTGDGAKFGKTTGLTMGQFFCKLMGEQRQEKLSDDDLAKAMSVEFPKGSDKYRYHIRMYRSMYNRGKWSAQCNRVPDFYVHQYINDKPQISHTGPKAKGEKE